MKLVRLVSGPFETNTYLIVSKETKSFVVVDPAQGSAEKMTERIKKIGSIEAIWITHSHWDHIAGCQELLPFHLPIFIHELDKENLETPGSDGLFMPQGLEGIVPSKTLKDGDIISAGKKKWEVIHTPGHTPGSVCFYMKDEGILISGDTLFKGTRGNTSFATSCPQLMGESLLKLSHLPPTTKVYPGHGLSTTIEREIPWMVSEGGKLLDVDLG
jgi:hydroxyacylglutathione hydrolase